MVAWWRPSSIFGRVLSYVVPDAVAAHGTNRTISLGQGPPRYRAYTDRCRCFATVGVQQYCRWQIARGPWLVELVIMGASTLAH
jgi:hypothetical protein